MRSTHAIEQVKPRKFIVISERVSTMAGRKLYPSRCRLRHLPYLIPRANVSFWAARSIIAVIAFVVFHQMSHFSFIIEIIEAGNASEGTTQV